MKNCCGNSSRVNFTQVCASSVLALSSILLAQETVRPDGPTTANSENQITADQGIREMQNIVVGTAAIGRPVDIRFTAIDGRNVDLPSLKGKVVIVHFWIAQYAHPDRRRIHRHEMEIPKLQALYDEFGARGLEIVGVSYDRDMALLEEVIERMAISWPQYCDGLSWKGRFSKEFGVSRIPALWLIDKRGNLRDENARLGEDLLREKVKTLMEE